MSIAFILLLLMTSECVMAEPSVWLMQVLAVDKDEVGVTGFTDMTGNVIVNANRDVQLVLAGSNLENVTQIAFTAQAANRGQRDSFYGVTWRFDTELSNNTMRATVKLGEELIGRQLYLILFTAGDRTPMFVGLQLTVQDLSSLFLPIWFQLPIVVLLLCLSSLFSGLNLGLMSLDTTGLKILKECGSDSEKTYARQIEPLRKRGNFLLCTLLLGNVLVNTTLTLLLDQLIGSGLIAVVFSTLAIVIFGEIIPQAICSRFGLMVGARTRYITILFMALTGALSWPLSKVLDCVLGQEIGTVYTRDKLSKLVEVQRAAMDIGDAEVDILTGVLRMRQKKAEDIMTPIDDVFMVSYDAVLDFNILNEIFTRGFSRIPVYDGEKSNVVNVLNVKDIAFLDPDDRVPIKAILKIHMDPQQNDQQPSPAAMHRTVVGGSQQNLVSEPEAGAVAATELVLTTKPVTVVQHDHNLILRIENDMPLDRLLQRFLENRCHMGFVFRTDDSDPARDPVQELIGLVTLEDLFEEIIQREILDEGDVQDRRGNVVKRRRAELRDFNAPGPVSLSPGLHLAAYQFLCNTELFHPELVSSRILMRLLKHKLVEEHDYIEYNTSASDYSEVNDRNYLYRPERGVDYFVLILQGHTDVHVGREDMQFDGGPFQLFGEQALTPINDLLAKHSKHDIRHLAKIVHALPKYKPDFKVRATTDLQYVKVDRATYLALRTRTIHIKQLPSANTHAISAETEDLILKDVEIAKNPDAISQSPTVHADLLNLDDCCVSSAGAGPKVTVAQKNTVPLTGTATHKDVASLRNAPITEGFSAVGTNTGAGVSPLLSKTGKIFMKSRNSVVNMPSAAYISTGNVAAQLSSSAARRISIGDVTSMQNSTPTAQPPLHPPDGRKRMDCAGTLDDRHSNQSLPSAVDSYVRMDESNRTRNWTSAGEDSSSTNERMRLLHDDGGATENGIKKLRANTDQQCAVQLELAPLQQRGESCPLNDEDSPN